MNDIDKDYWDWSRVGCNDFSYIFPKTLKDALIDVQFCLDDGSLKEDEYIIVKLKDNIIAQILTPREAKRILKLKQL